MVAKSYQHLPIICEPYLVNGRQYVKVRLESGNLRQVRWYTEQEYAKYYGCGNAVLKASESQKEAFGFANGPITIFRGDTYPYKEYLKSAGAKYSSLWGWYFPSGSELPDVPTSLAALPLDWETVGLDNGLLKSESIVKAEVAKLIQEPSDSRFVGEIGDRIEIRATVKRAIPVETQWGRSTIHTFETPEKNIFVWKTTAKSLEPGSNVHLRGTLKAHNIYNGVQQNILTRCTLIEG